MRLAFLIFTCAFAAAAQQLPHRFTAALGTAVPAAGAQIQNYSNSPLLSLNYGWRYARYGQFDAGADIVWGQSRGGDRTHFVLPVGYRAVLPLWEDRIEASLGAGGAYIAYKPQPPGFNSWLVYGLLETNYALDSEGRYRAGVLVRWYRDPIGAPVQQWVNIGGAFTITFR